MKWHNEILFAHCRRKTTTETKEKKRTNNTRIKVKPESYKKNTELMECMNIYSISIKYMLYAKER